MRHFRDAHSLERGLDHHLAGELHARRPQIEAPPPRLLAETAQAAMKVAAGTVKKQAADAGQDRISQIPVQTRHGAWLIPP